MTNFWILELIKFVVLLLLAYGLGRAVQETGIKVNYTRKIIHFALFFLPEYLKTFLPYKAGFGTILVSGTLFLLTIALMVKPIRSRFSLFNTAFASIDRSEVALTLCYGFQHRLWLLFQFSASSCICWNNTTELY